jgi:membrane protein required for colicin V production
MTELDIAVIGILALSTLLAFARGVVRELIALVTWIVGIGLALRANADVAAVLPEIGGSPAARYVVAFALVFVAVFVAGAAVALAVRAAVRAAGLGFADRFLGAAFGFARGLVVLLVLALVAGMTALPQRDWWQNAAVAPLLAAAVIAAKPWLPPAWAEHLDYAPAGRTPAQARSGAVPAGAGEPEPCVES